MKSLNSPRITGLSAMSGPVSGGNSLAVTGSALNGVTEVRVGKVVLPASGWRIDSSTQLTILSVPKSEGTCPVEVGVTNFWGKSPAGTKDVYIYVGDGSVWQGDKVVQEALKYVGVPYTWAGASPTSGFDCSGFAMYVYGKLGITLPHYSRSQATYGTAVAKADLKPGDLIFFYTPISHVGIYVGGGMMINAPRSGDLVTIENAYRTSYVAARRIVSPYDRYQQNDPGLVYSGTWSANVTTTAASGGSFRYANASGASVTVKFTGTSFIWLNKKSPVYGIANVVVDGAPPVQVDLYNATEIWQQKVWQSATLSAGTHTITISWTGAKNPAATNTNIGVDAVDILGTMGLAPVTTTTLAPTTTTVTPTTTTSPVTTTTTTSPVTTTTTTTTLPVTTTTTTSPVVKRFEQGDANLLYLGTWSANVAGPAASGGRYCYADVSGASITIKFTGTSFTWVTKKNPKYGKARLTLDGGIPTIIDLYSATEVWQQKVWQSTNLKQGTHTVKIEWTGTKNPSAVDYNIGADAFDIAGTVEPVLTGLVVVIDPGHQGKPDLTLEPMGPGSTVKKAKVAAGAVGVVTRTPESQLVLAVSLKLKAALEAQGITVIMTRTTQDVNISNMQRALLANQVGADLLIRVHADAHSNSAVSGAHILYPATIAGWTDDIALPSKNAATIILKELVAATGAKNLGLMVRSDMTGFNWSNVPVIIPEIGFMTNPAEDRLLATTAYQDKVVQGLTKGILSFLGTQ